MSELSDWNILIVEDEKDAQDVIITLLKQHKMQISTAFTGEEAIEKLRSVRPNIALIDLALPGIDGWAVLEAIRADPGLQNITACAMTAYHSTVVAKEAIKAGFNAYFPKPISARTFVEDLVNVVG
jgi:CheY-like chemotaxis protein